MIINNVDLDLCNKPPENAKDVKRIAKELTKIPYDDNLMRDLVRRGFSNKLSFYCVCEAYKKVVDDKFTDKDPKDILVSDLCMYLEE